MSNSEVSNSGVVPEDVAQEDVVPEAGSSVPSVPSPRSTPDATTPRRKPSLSDTAAGVVWGITRIALGFIFFWAFLDKMFGLGKSTPSNKAWIHGGSPTTGFLDSVKGPFAGFFHGMAGQTWADYLFMIGLCGIGIALILGVAMRLAVLGGVAMMVFMYLASLPLSSNPFLDDHLIYALVLIGLALVRADHKIGLGSWWERVPVLGLL
jgi:thiosulfate dehydrogenase (quinone) large subunit